jgi:PurA ssDNA and RNA-binding protein
MISNDPMQAQGSRPHGERAHSAPKAPVNEETLKSSKIQIERKTFVLALKENSRGRFLRITEDVGGRRDTIIIPAPGLEEFSKVLDEMVQAAGETPPKAE